ncbi:MAG: hypothetical protein GC159_16465 [Phycisphaera sp.]|nr:hypothetical protein [Phycisphaera sp.]
MMDDDIETPGAADRTARRDANLAVALLGVTPLGLLLAEAIVGAIIFGIGMIFIVTILLSFVGFLLWYLGLWIAISMSMVGVGIALMTLFAGRRYTTGKLLGVTCLAIHVAVIIAAGVTLQRLHDRPKSIWDQGQPSGTVDTATAPSSTAPTPTVIGETVETTVPGEAPKSDAESIPDKPPLPPEN